MKLFNSSEESDVASAARTELDRITKSEISFGDSLQAISKAQEDINNSAKELHAVINIIDEKISSLERARVIAEDKLKQFDEVNSKTLDALERASQDE